MDKKKLPQIIIIGLLVAVCAGFCIVKITGNKPDPAPVNKQESTNVKPLDLTADTGEQLTTDGDAPLAVTLNTGTPYPVTKRDPFSPTMDLSERIAVAQVPPSSTLVPIPSRNTGTSNGRIWPGLQPLPIDNTVSAQPSGQEATAQAQIINPLPKDEEPFPNFVLTGVITGRSKVAIIRLGEGRYIAKEGQLINGGYKVVSVTQEGVLISRDGRSVFLKLGGEGNAS